MSALRFEILLLIRFLCFLAVFYLALHKVVARLSRKPNGKLLWFFEALTAPLVHPVHVWLLPAAPNDRLLTGALLFYASLWLFFILLEHLFPANSR